jgi:GcrA cell cycle regulator
MSAIHETWTSERVALLRSYFDAGLSCSQIAREIGTTRNAVIGKMHRLGLSRPKDPFADRLAARDPARPKAVRRKPWRLNIHAQHEMLMATYPCGADEATAVESVHKCSLLELRQAQCRWPISEPGAQDFAFCGNRSVDGLSYCVGHARIAYRVPGRGRRQAGG